ncbi:MAG: zinc-ribbon domain-containing protein, partial [Halapricum sp.]
MAWRRSDDPRCPECGEKLAATASFCMHCEADLPDGLAGGTTETVGGDSPAGDDYDSDPTPTDHYDPESPTTPSESADYSGLDDDEDGIEKTTLLLRGPIALVMAFPAALLALFGVVGAFDSLPAVGALVVLVGSYVAVAVYFGRKPLASDAIGDGLYLYGVLFVTIPLLWMVGDLVRLALGTIPCCTLKINSPDGTPRPG